MKHQKLFFTLTLGIVCLWLPAQELAPTIPSGRVVTLAGNAYVIDKPQPTNDNITEGSHRRARGAFIGNRGVMNWNDTATVIRTYVSMSQSGMFELSMRASGHSSVKVSVNGAVREVSIDSDTPTTIPVGSFAALDGGYNSIDLQGVSGEANRSEGNDEKRGRPSNAFGQVEAYIITGYAGTVACIGEEFSTHFGRRGPSAHLNYRLPDTDVEWFYNEITVPSDGEVVGSYYMACGFAQGYFGMQYNSESERRVLFSVWSPFDTQNPQEIPDDERVKVLAKGDGVRVNDFGGEGSGGQSYMVYDWKAGSVYRFLMRVHPDGKGNTQYTAYFAPQEEEWRLVASFLRPKTDTWYKGAHSFLENFSPDMGNRTRYAYYGNQWAIDNKGVAYPLTQAVFTCDDTGRNGRRLDYTGGVDAGRFYLKMGGFFNGDINHGTPLKREETGAGVPPQIDGL